MKLNTESSLRETLEQMATQQLDEMLQQELRKDKPEEETVLTIMEILRERDATKPVEIDGEIRNAWADFQENCAADHAEKVAKKRDWVMRAAAIAAVVCILVMTVPQAVGADSVFELIARWTESTFSFFDQPEGPAEYVFKTEHPGLQEIYDAVTEAGGTQPVVPMWVPDGYELKELKTIEMLGKTEVYASLVSADGEIVLTVILYHAGTSNEYTKDKTHVKMFEWAGIAHYIMGNDGTWTAAWAKDRVECSISAVCQEDTLYEMLYSIYTTEDYK